MILVHVARDIVKCLAAIITKDIGQCERSNRLAFGSRISAVGKLGFGKLDPGLILATLPVTLNTQESYVTTRTFDENILSTF